MFGAQCKCKAGAGGYCKHVAALLYCILDYSDHQLTQIPDHRTCTDKPQHWNVAKEITDGGSILFSVIQIVHHTYGKRKAEEECNTLIAFVISDTVTVVLSVSGLQLFPLSNFEKGELF